MPSLTIDIPENVLKILKKRADKNLLSTKEQVEDIIRRSAVSYKSNSSISEVSPDDRLVSIFSRQRKGRSSKKKKY